MEKVNNISPSNTTIGWIGTGVMGAPMANHLISKGYKCYVYNRTKTKAVNLINKGASWLENPQEISNKANIIFTIVSFPQDVEEVYYGNKGLLNNKPKGKIFVDMTTTKPSLAIKIYNETKSMYSYFIDAPVSGGDIGAKNASLSIMAGGDKETFEKVLPIFKLLGKNIVFQGKAGSGQHAKICNQIVIAGTIIGVCENLLYSYKAGLDPNVLLSSIGKGAAACWTLDNLAPRIIKNDYEPGFFIEHFIKDLEIALEETRKMDLSLPGLSLAHQLYTLVKESGYGKKGTQALMLALEKISGIN
jgi:3-hydroxyisobutyrate dehydrogenase